MRLLTAIVLAAFCAAAAAQLRPIPPAAKVGSMRHLGEMTVELDGTPQQLAPGVQIRDAQNRLVLPVALRERETVRYLRDNAGFVFRVWRLSEAEIKALPPAPSPFPK